MKTVCLVHCWDGTIDDGWYPWLINILKSSNIKVIAKNMPNTESPTISEWVEELDNLVTSLDENTYFIGHSIGCQAIMRYLETKDTTKIGGMLFVAPWLRLLPAALVDGADLVAKPWVETPIDFAKVKQFTANTTCIFSDDDYFVPLDQEKELQNKLNARTIMLSDKGHISSDDGITELPAILTATGEMLGLEFLEIMDKNDNPTGQILERNLAHDKNLLHREVGVFIFNSKNETLIQKRALNKRTHPGKWGLCAGHVAAYESVEEACLKELKEELGIDLTPDEVTLFDQVTKIRSSNSHITYEYYTFMDRSLSDFTLQESEVSAIKWIPFTDLKQMIISNDPSITFSNNPDNLKMIEKLERILTAYS